jgi:hypothetical protein
MIEQFFQGVGNGLLALMGVVGVLLFTLWIALPVLVWRLLRVQRALLAEVRALREQRGRWPGGRSDS